MTVLAKDRIGKCHYTITLQGRMLVCEMRGYGLKATETQKLRKGADFNTQAAKLTLKMVTLERRMRDLARLTTQLAANNVTGVARLVEPSVRRPARGVNPLTSLMEQV